MLRFRYIRKQDGTIYEDSSINGEYADAFNFNLHRFNYNYN